MGIMKYDANADAQESNSNGAATITEKVFPKSIALVEEDVTGGTEHIIYYEAVSSNGTSNTVFTQRLDPVTGDSHPWNYTSIDLEVGYLVSNTTGYDEDLYVTLDLHRLPQSDWATYRDLTSVELQALVNPDDNSTYTTPKTFVTVASCNDTSWYHYDTSSENYLNDWKTVTDKSCYNSAVQQDSVIVKSNDLPMSYRWDITDSVLDAYNKYKQEVKDKVPINLQHSNMTFVFFGTECPEKQPCLFLSPSSDLVQFLSYNVSSSKSGLGRNLSPLFVVTYKEAPSLASQTQDLLSPSNILAPSNLATLGTAIASGASWIFREEIKKHAKTLHGMIRERKSSHEGV